MTLAAIAEELNVDAIVEGSAQRVGDGVRIMTQLIEPETSQALWAETYEGDFQDVLVLQSEVARAVAREVEVAVTPEEVSRLANARPVNPEAHEAYLKGSFYENRLTPQDLDTALSYFELALEKDPDYALAYAGIARLWADRQQMGLVPPSEATPKSKDAARKALELDESLAEVHGQLAVLSAWSDWDWTAAEAGFERAIELNPNYAYARSLYSHLLMIMKRPDEAMAQIERAVELDPLNAVYRALYGVDLNFVRRFDDAIVQLQNALKTSPDIPFAQRALSEAFYHKRMYEESLAVEKSLFAAVGYPELEEVLDRGYAQGGYQEAMRRAAETLADRSRTTFVMPSDVAYMFLLGEDNDRALEWLEKAYEAHDPNMPYIGLLTFDPLRDDRRFQDLLRRMNLPE